MTSDTTDYAGLIDGLHNMGLSVCREAADAIEALLAREAALIERVKELEVGGFLGDPPKYVTWAEFHYFRSRAEDLEQQRDALRKDNEQWKKVYDLRGKALARPCLNCGHVQATIIPQDALIVELAKGKAMRHHNNKGLRQIKRGKTRLQVKAIAKRLGVPYASKKPTSDASPR